MKPTAAVVLMVGLGIVAGVFAALGSRQVVDVVELTPPRSPTYWADLPGRPRSGYVDATRVNCFKGDVFTDGTCQEDIGQGVIPNTSLKLQKLLADTPVEGSCKSVFFDPGRCGTPNRFMNWPMIDLLFERVD